MTLFALAATQPPGREWVSYAIKLTKGGCQLLLLLHLDFTMKIDGMRCEVISSVKARSKH